jgi:hypothetical protein
MKKGAYAGNVQKAEHSVLIHGTKLRPTKVTCQWGVRRLLYSIKHVTVTELNELVETIARVNSKTCRS